MNACLLKSFGNSVRTLRESREWSQEQLAEKADLNRSYVGEIERGQVVASIVTVEKLAHAFGISGARMMELSERSCTAQLVQGIDLTSIAC